MASVSSGKSGPSPAASCLIILLIFLLLGAVLCVASYLGNPWYAIGRLALYGGLLWLIVKQLRECIRMAKSPDHARQLKFVGLCLALTGLGVLAHGGDMLGSDNTDFVDVATDLWVYLALLTLLELTKSLLGVTTQQATQQREASAGAAPRET
jgi:hypothetical protein